MLVSKKYGTVSCVLQCEMDTDAETRVEIRAPVGAGDIKYRNRLFGGGRGHTLNLHAS